MENQKKSVFEVLSSINVNDHVDKKKDLTYLSWAWAWSITKKHYPNATYQVNGTVEDPDMGFMCHTSVTIEGETLSMWLPVLDGANKSMKRLAYEYLGTGWENGKRIQVTKSVEAATNYEINKTIMRCLVKNLAMFGLGIYIYAKEDAPDVFDDPTPAPAKTSAKSAPKVEDTREKLNSKHPNWSKVTQYITDNKATEFTVLMQQLSRKYQITPAVQKELETIKTNA